MLRATSNISYFFIKNACYGNIVAIFKQYCCELPAIFLVFSSKWLFIYLLNQYFCNISTIFISYFFNLHELHTKILQQHRCNIAAISFVFLIRNFKKKKHGRYMQYCIFLAGCCCDIIATSQCCLARYMQYCIYLKCYLG